MNKNAIIAVFKRNLASYFGSPSGYVFICAFLLASGLAAFWPQEFFDSNLANLDQLNKFLPHILLGFIPAITMSIWADERRQGTDELLLTLPGSDFDVVLGKYFGAVAIFSASIVISLLANYYVLGQLGNPDFGLLFSTYVGYWFVGLAMLAIGMVASFLTANLTVAFVLGVAFNAPIALLSDSQWGISYNFLDFSRGIISISGIAFFVGVAIAMLYLCSILIGRRHWVGSAKGTSKITHYSIRVVAALIIALGLTQFFRYNDVIRIDSTEEQLSSLSSGSISVLKNLNSQVEIDAFVSPADSMPEQYVQTRINLLTALKEIDRESKSVMVKIHEITPEDNASVTAEKYGVENQNGINPPLFVQEDGRFMPWQKDLYLGLVFKGNGSQQTIPFLYKGLPVEYEIMRTLSSVSGPVSKKKLGVFATDAPLLGSGGMGIMGFNMGGGSPAWEVISELRKQYDVQEVTGGEISKDDYDALLVVQPNNLDNEKMDDLISAIKSGIPTAIFEDPLPLIQGGLTGTYEPRRNNQGGGGPGQPPPPAPEKGDLNKLWDLLGVHFNVNPKERLAAIIKELNDLQLNASRSLAPARGKFPEVGKFFSKLDELVKKASEYNARLNANSPLTSSDWDSLKLDELRKTVQDLDYNHPIRNFVEQRLLSNVETRLNGMGKRVVRDPYNPFPKIPRSENFPDEFVYVGGLPNSFGDGPETSELQYCLFTCPGSIYPKGNSALTFKPLLSTRGGNLAGTTSVDNFWTGGVFGSPRRFNPDRTIYGGSGDAEVIAANISGSVKDGNQTNQMNVILVADADVLADPFFNIRSRGPDSDFPLDVDNVTLCLNLIDSLSGENSLLEIRNRRRLHRTLEEFEKSIEAAREVATRTIKEAEQSIQQVLQDENRKLNEALSEVQGSQGSMTQGQFMQVLQTEAAKLQKNLAKKERELRKESNAKIKDAERSRDREIKAKQESIQRLSVFLPPLPLLVIAFVVFYRKKKAEIQGAYSSRVRS
ncbi:MAG: Gldg family protein [Verrucomicrobiota bacterium]|nr:Gldg family protein [Verrucomicrobiota bacterium]